MEPEPIQAICDSIRNALIDVQRSNIPWPKRRSHLELRVSRLAGEFGFRSVAHYPISLASQTNAAARTAAVDVVWMLRHQNGPPVVTVQVDASPREESVATLLAVPADLRVWACLSTRGAEEVLERLDLQRSIHLMCARKSDPGGEIESGGGKRPAVSIFNEVRQWAARHLAYWEQYALMLLMDGKQIGDDDLGRIYGYLLEDAALRERTAPRPPLTFAQDRLAGSVPERVRLDAICDVTGVNALADGQRLEFHPQLTAIYGENGADKSGYARVLGSAGFTRGDSMVLPDVTQPLRENATQSATITVTAGDCTQSFDYEVGAQCPRLSGFYVFDSTAVRVHMSAPNAISFSPAGLSVLPRLAAVTDDVRALLNTEIRERGNVRDFAAAFAGESDVKTFVAAVGPATDRHVLRNLATLSEGETARLGSLTQEISELRALDISQRIGRVKQQAKDLYDLDRLLSKAAQELSDDRLRALADALDERNRWQRAVQEEGWEQFGTDASDNIGSDTWRRFVQAAQALAEVEGSESAPYPQPESRCLLCRQPLNDEAHGLLHGLWRFLRGEAQANLQRTNSAVDTLRTQIETLDLDFFTPHTAWYRTIGEQNPQLRHAVEAYLSECHRVRRQAVAAETTLEMPPAPMTASLALQVRTMIDVLDMQVAELEADDPTERLRALEQELLRLQHRILLAELYEEIDAYVQDQKWAAQARGAAGTTGHITRKHNEMFDKLVSIRYVSLFRERLAKLGRPLLVTVKTSGRKGDVVKQIVVSADSSHSKRTAAAEYVLSEGEKRVVALADFLTEAVLDTESNGVVLDDPVTSLDVEWRQVIAAMLAHEASAKQVIVFTHDMPFLYYLKQAAENRRIGQRTHWIRRGDHDGRPGYVFLDNSPALERDYRSSKIANECLERAKQASPQDQARHLRKGFGALRTSYEAFVVFQLLNEVVVRWGERISFGRLTGIVWDQEIVTEVNESCERLSRYIEGHLHSDAYAGSGPTLQDLNQEIQRFDALRKRHKELSKQASGRSA